MLPREIVDDVAAGRFHVYARASASSDALEIALDSADGRPSTSACASGCTCSPTRSRGTAGDRPPSGATVTPPSTPLPDPQAP